MSGGTDGCRPAGLGTPPLRCPELCPGGADAGGQALGEAEVSASGPRTKGSRERAGPHVPRPAPRLRDFIAPTPARDAAEHRSAPAAPRLPTLGIGCPRLRGAARRGGRAAGRNAGGREGLQGGDFAKCRFC